LARGVDAERIVDFVVVVEECYEVLVVVFDYLYVACGVRLFDEVYFCFELVGLEVWYYGV